MQHRKAWILEMIQTEGKIEQQFDALVLDEFHSVVRPIITVRAESKQACKKEATVRLHFLYPKAVRISRIKVRETRYIL